MRQRVASPGARKESDKAQGASTAASAHTSGTDTGKNFADGGAFDSPFYLITCPLFAQITSFITSEKTQEHNIDPTLGAIGLLSQCTNQPKVCYTKVVGAMVPEAPTMAAFQFLVGFFIVAIAFERLLPGKVEAGPMTLTGHIPKYKDNAMLHCFLFSALFLSCSNFGFGLYDFGVFYDVFPPCLFLLQCLGYVLAVFLCYKGLRFPSTKDSGPTGSRLKDFTWGTELYPRVFGIDIKRFINCRFSMTYWQLANLSFAYRSYTLHNKVDYGIVLSAVSQYLYLVKFFMWEIGYMRSIDIIHDRAGWQIQWGCLVWVPSIYTLQCRFLVLHPSGLSFTMAMTIFALGLLSVALNYWADLQRKYFRECNGQCLIWGKKPVVIEATYKTTDKDGRVSTHKSLLLASGFWGIARHLQYLFELGAAWSWCLLANPFVNGALPLFYAVFLTILLITRAKRDERKCSEKYGPKYNEYAKVVPYHIIPGIY